MVANGSFVSPLANAAYPTEPSALLNAFGTVIDSLNGWTVAISLFLALVLYDQYKYVIQKGSIAGEALKMPFIGPFLESVNPKFEKYHAKWMSGPLSCVSVFHKFVVIASTRDMARKVFTAPTFCKPCVVDIAHKLLRPNNWVFLDGKAHVDYRKGLNGLFSRSALAIYLPRQEEVYHKYFQHFQDITKKAGGKAIPFMPHFRELIVAVSCRTFVGFYMADETVLKIAEDYYNITAALELVNFPFIIPFTKTWYGKKAADMVLVEFAKCGAKSKVRMAAGGEVICILDAWVRQMQDCEEYRRKIAEGIEVPAEEKPSMMIRMFTDLEIAMTLFTFLFASQDATSSAITWLFQITADRPDVLNKLRAEHLALRNGDANAPLTLSLLDQATYSRAVVKEVLRYRPPVIMVPYLAKKPFPITDTYTAPVGAMVVPTTWPALHDPEAYPDPDNFIPERWITGDAEKQVKNWLVFGAGPHVCLGQTYAINNLIALIGIASMKLDWSHEITPLSEEIRIFATIFPKDNCRLAFTKRVEA